MNDRIPKKISWIWYEMARRYRAFHNGEDWRNIKLWGLFTRSQIKYQLDSGDLIASGSYSKRATMWVRPSEKAYQTKIKPLLDRYTLPELERMSGW